MGSWVELRTKLFTGLHSAI